MMIRIPGWVQDKVVPSDLYAFSDDVKSDYKISVNGTPVAHYQLNNGYLAIDRNWEKGDVVRIHFDMPVRTVVANSHVADDCGRVAVERGPLVYCAEWADNEGINPHELQLAQQPQFKVEAGYGIKNTEGDGKTFNVTAITAQAQEGSVKLIPYYAWNHRGAGKMDVWLILNKLKRI